MPTPHQIARAYGFDDEPVFAPVFAPWHEAQASTLGDLVAGDLGLDPIPGIPGIPAAPTIPTVAPVLDFYGDAKAKLGNQVTATEDQALAAMNGWADQAKSAVLDNLDPNLVALTRTAVQGVQIVASGGLLSPETFQAVAGLVVGSLGGGPVAAAAMGSLVTSLFVMGQAITAVFKLFGLAASTQSFDPDLLSNFGWVKRQQIIPGGPSDHGDGTYQRPGWQSVLDQIDAMGKAGVFVCGAANGSAAVDSGKLAAFVRALPAYLNGQSVGISEDVAQPWCEMQAAPIDDFRQFFYRLFYRNIDSIYNVSPVAPVDPQALLGRAADVWNLAHEPGTPQIYSAAGATPGVFPSIISRIMAGYIYYSGDQRPGMPDLAIHTGPLIAPPAPARVVVPLHWTPHVAASTASTAGSTSPAAVVAASTVGVAAVGAGLWWLLGKPLTGHALRLALTHGWRAVLAEFGR